MGNELLRPHPSIFRFHRGCRLLHLVESCSQAPVSIPSGILLLRFSDHSLDAMLFAQPILVSTLDAPQANLKIGHYNKQIPCPATLSRPCNAGSIAASL